MLRLSSGPKLTDYFGVFIFADGGGTVYSSKGNLPILKGKFAYACWGSEKGSNKPNTSHLPKALKAKGATVSGSEMAGTGQFLMAAGGHPGGLQQFLDPSSSRPYFTSIGTYFGTKSGTNSGMLMAHRGRRWLCNFVRSCSGLMPQWRGTSIVGPRER